MVRMDRERPLGPSRGAGARREREGGSSDLKENEKKVSEGVGSCEALLLRCGNTQCPWSGSGGSERGQVIRNHS